MLPSRQVKYNAVIFLTAEYGEYKKRKSIFPTFRAFCKITLRFLLENGVKPIPEQQQKIK
jgi:hypothetical protein